MESGQISNRQIEAARIAITRCARRGGKVWIRIFPDKPTTKKPAETRMGKGKELLRDGLQLFAQEEFFMKWKGCLRKWPAKRLDWPPRNCQSKLNLLHGTGSNESFKIKRNVC